MRKKEKREKKEKKEKKENPIYSLIVFIAFVMAILFFIIKFITNIFYKEDIYDMNNITQYIQKDDGSVDDSKLVKNYTRFHTIQEILEQFTDALINNKYDETYKILDDEMLKVYKDKNTYIETIKKFTNDNFIIKDPNIIFSNKNKLKRLYSLSTTDYLAEYQTINGNIKKIGVRLDNQKNKYTIFYIEM